MILPLHIVLALSSLILTFINTLSPTKHRIHGAYTLCAGTLLSGSLLVMSAQVSLSRACISGIIYTVVAASGSIYSTRKLSFVKITTKNDHVRD